MAFEDFTSYTEVDPSNHWSQTSTRNTASSLNRTEDSYVYKDYNADTFGDYIHEVDIYVSSLVIYSNIQFIVWGVTDNPASFTDMTEGQIVTVGAYAGVARSLRLVDKGTSNEDRYDSLSLDTPYYLTIERSGATCTCKIYSDSDRTSLIDTLTITCQTDSYRYLEIGGSYDFGSGSGGSFYSENLDLGLPETINIEESENFSLSDDIQFKLLWEIEENLSLSDKLVLNLREIEIDEILNLEDNNYFNVTLEKSEFNPTLSLSDDLLMAFIDTKDIDNDFRLAIENIEDVENKFNMGLGNIEDVINYINTAELEIVDINQKINTVQLEQSDMRMAFHSAYGIRDDISNKVNTLARTINDMTNDFRMKLSWQVAGDLGIQSLGKEYVKVYFDNVIVADADIESIKINKVLGGTHIATFNLNRAYDVNHPDLESLVHIRYNGYLLYKGYITSIAPTDDPEQIAINCQDKYWLDNRNKVWFNIGHEPSDETELYYNKINQGLSAVGVSFNIGNFIPQTMNLFGTGRSDAISSMVQNSGNFDWYYDVNDVKRLWTANGGSIINLERQELGKNLGLYQVLRHDITESAENLVNKYRVQMGDQIIRHPGRQGETREYRARIITTSRVRAIPVWTTDKERLAKSNSLGYGFDYHPSGDYGDVFKKFKILNTYLLENEEWTDWKNPVVEITRPFGAGGSTSSTGIEDTVGTSDVLTEGFSIDYKTGILTLNEKTYFYDKNEKNEMDKLYTPVVTLILYKQTWITHTETTEDDPETETTNDLMFFTNKIGSYPKTILGTLNLGGLSKQGGGTFTSTGADGLIYTHTPSWDDTNFAKDLAYWKLSETADKKISGTIDITLDASIFYGISLNKRIMIDGILESPLNITDINYDMSNFIVRLTVESFRYYKRSVSIPSHGQGVTFSSSVSNVRSVSAS